MNSDRTIFAQVMDHLPWPAFRQCVKRYKGEHKVLSFTCYDQFLCMAFAQLTYRESLRDIEACLRFAGPKLYHMGFRGRVSRTTLADANEKRDWRIYADFAHGADRRGEEALRRGSFRRELEAHRLRARRHHHRSVPVGVPLGQVQKHQGRREGERAAWTCGGTSPLSCIFAQQIRMK